MHGAKLSMPPNTFTCLRLRSTSSDSSHTTWDIDDKSGGPSARVEALDRAEPLDPHVLAPRRRVLKRPASQISSDSFKYWRACPHVLCSRHLCRILHNCLTSEKDDVASARGDKHAKDELSDETEQDAMTVQADDGDIIQDRRAGPYGLSSPHLGRRLDHSSIHVLTNATDQDEVAADRTDEHTRDEFGDETVEPANGVLADSELGANKDWRACPHVAHTILVGNSTDQDEVAAADVDEHAKDEFGDETVEQANGVLEDGDLAGNKDRKASPLVLYVLLIS